MAANFSDVFSSFSAGVSDLFAAGGYSQAASGYAVAAGMEDVNARISKASTGIQHAAARRVIYKAVGGQRSDVLGAGFSFSGTAMDLEADSLAQGSLAQAIIQNQGAIETQGHLIQAFSYRQQAAQAKSSAKSSTLGGFLNIGLGILSLFSDPSLKRNIKFLGKDARGLNKYEFSYIGTNTRWIGYMADELPETETVDAVGFLSVSEPYQAMRA